MEFLDRTFVRVALVVALIVYAAGSAGMALKMSPARHAFVGAAQRTPVALALRLERRHNSLMLAVLVQFRQEEHGLTLGDELVERDLKISGEPLELLLRRLAKPQRAD